MVDRVAVLAGISPQAVFSAAAGKKFNDQLTKAIGVAMGSLPLAKARELPEPVRAEVGATLRGLLTFAELKAVAKSWEPKRKVEPDESQTQLANNLEALLLGVRPPYSIPTENLVEAIALASAELDSLLKTLVEVAPWSDLKKVAKKWDKHNLSLQTLPRKQVIERLVALATGAEKPAVKPPPRAK
jgi:hypothetical protein